LKILFICTGNTCRSPLVAALADHTLDDDEVSFVSAGLAALPNMPASTGTLTVAAEHGISLAEHRAQPLSQALLADMDWVIGMTRSQVAIFKSRFPDFRGRIGLLGEPGVDLSQRTTPDAMQIADPYGGPVQEYRAMAEQVGQLVKAWLPFFRTGKQEPADTESHPRKEAS
jgi:protein-tyrosine-phosphatase